MAKQSHNFNIGPWPLKNKQINDFIPVTKINRKHIVVQGRILYVIEGRGNPYTYSGYFTIDPCFTKGWWMYPFLPFSKRESGQSHFKFRQDEDVNRDEWARNYNKMITDYIEKEILYIRQEDPILLYYKV